MFYATGYHYQPAAGKFPSVVRKHIMVRKAVAKLKKNVEMHHMRELRRQRAPGAADFDEEVGPSSRPMTEPSKRRTPPKAAQTLTPQRQVPPRAPSPCLCAMDLADDQTTTEDEDDVVVVSVRACSVRCRLPMTANQHTICLPMSGQVHRASRSPRPWPWPCGGWGGAAVRRGMQWAAGDTASRRAAQSAPLLPCVSPGEVARTPRRLRSLV